MPTDVQVGDSIITFPDGMSPEQIQQTLNTKLRQPGGLTTGKIPTPPPAASTVPQLSSDYEQNRNIPWNEGVPKGTIMQHPFQSAWELLNTPIIKAEPLPSTVKEAQESKSPIVKAAFGVHQAADDFLSSLTSPLGAGTVGLATTPKLGALLTAAFALTTGKAAAVDIPQELGTELGKNPSDMDVSKVAQLITSEALTAPMTGVLGEGVLQGLRPQVIHSDVARPMEPQEKIPTKEKIPGQLTLNKDQVANLRLRNLKQQEDALEPEKPTVEVPAIKTSDGTIIPGQKGQTHINIIQAAVKSGKLDDLNVQHGFMSSEGQYLDRRQAADLLGEKEPLHSERLIELQKTQPPTYKQIPVKPNEKPVVSRTMPAGPEAAPKTGQPFTTTVYRGVSSKTPSSRSIYASGEHYTTSKEYADTYGVKQGGTTSKAEITLKNPFVATPKEMSQLYHGLSPREVREKLQTAGHDGVVILHSDNVAESKAAGVPDRLLPPATGKEIIKFTGLSGTDAARNLQLDPANKNISHEQVYNTIKNQAQKGELSPTEFELMDKAGLKEKLAEHPTREELAKWVQEKTASESPKQELKQVPTKKEKPLSPVAKQLGLDKETTVGGVIRNLASAPDLHGKLQAKFAKLLDDKFGHILDFASIDTGKPPGYTRAAYDPFTHKTYLDLEGGDLTYTVLHEAAHAAMHWLVEHPVTEEHRLVADEISNIRNHMIDVLPTKVNKFFSDVYRSWSLKNPHATWEEEMALFRAHDLDPEVWHEPMYFLMNNSEFVAGVMSPGGNFRDMLNHTEYKNAGIWQAIKDLFRQGFGITKGSALDAAFDNIVKLGDVSKDEDTLPRALRDAHNQMLHEQGDLRQAPLRHLPSEDKDGHNGDDILYLADSIFEDPPKGKWDKFKEWNNVKLNQLAGWSMPKTMASSRDAGNAGIRYASSRIAAPLMAKALASEVLGVEPYRGEGVVKEGQVVPKGKARWNDPEWQNKVGAALVEDRLRAIWYSLKADGKDAEAAKVQHIWAREDSPLKTQKEVSDVLNDPEVKEAIARFKRLIEDPAREMHVKLGGKIAMSGPESGAFVNIKNLGDEVEKMSRGGSRQGDITNPLKRGSAFNKKAKGTGENYEFNFRTLMENMVQGNYEEYTKQHWYQELVKSGLAEALRPNENAPKGYQKIAIDRRGKSALNLWVRNDISSEVRQATQTDSPVYKGSLQYLIDKLTDLQLIGPIDVLVHLRNMFSAIAGSQGGGSASWDIMRKIPGVRGLDTIVRIVKNTRDVMLDTPGVQKEIASFTRIGAGRGAVEHIGVIQKYLPTGKLVTLIDKASRLTLSRMYDNLVEREWAKDTEEGRREFINRMGQYNTRLMGKWTQQLKQSSISSFVVAGKNFNRLALQRLILNPGVEAANPQAALKMKLVDAVGFISTMMTLPMVINYYTTGSIWGRPGVAPGAIDTGETKNGKPVELDLVQNILIRRGLNISGGSVAYKDYKQGRGGTEMLYDAFLDQIRGFASPYEGPAVKFLTTAITGHDTGGYLQSDNPHNLGENFLAALKQANPSVMKYFQAKEEGTSEAAGVLQPLTQWAGYGTGHKPSLVEQEQAVPGIEKMNLKKRADVQQSFTKSEIPLTPKQHLIMEQGAKDKADQVKEKVNSELKPETQTWLKSQKLEVPGFVEYLEQTGVKVYLLPKEREQYMEIMVKSYEDAIRKAKPFVENMKTQEQKKKVLEVYLRSAHGIAKNKMKNLIGK